MNWQQTTLTYVQATDTPLDQTLYRIGDFLAHYLARINGNSLLNDGSLLIDVAALVFSTSRTPEQSRIDWQKQKVLPIRLDAASLIIGPLVDLAAGDKPCPACLERRWLVIRTAEYQEAVEQGKDIVISGQPPLLTPFALEAASALAVALLQPGTAQNSTQTDVARFYALDLKTVEPTRHELIADSLCPVCANPQPDTAEAACITITSRPKPHSTAYHLVEATNYDLPESGLVNPVAGLLGSRSLPDYALTITAPVSGFFWIRNKYRYLHQVWWTGRSDNYKLSHRTGILEGLERFSGQAPRSKTLSIVDSYQNLAPNALNPIDTGLYQPQFYEKNTPAYLPFTPDREIPWVWGYSFKKQQPVQVPEQLVYYLDHRFNYPNFIQDCSSGCAIGSCLEEAILFGLLELIERDAFLIAWNAQLALPMIDPWSCKDPGILYMLDRVDRLGYDIHLFDMRLDLTPPAVMGLAMRRSDGLGKMVFAAGASLDPMIAIDYALGEVASYVPGFEDRVQARLDEIKPMVNDYSLVTQLMHHGLLYGLPEMTRHIDFLFQGQQPRSVEETYHGYLQNTMPRSQDLREDLEFCINEVLGLGMDVIVVDQTPPEVRNMGLSTVCVIVPGLMPMDFGWERQRVHDLPRLRTVPRMLGYFDHDFVLDPEALIPHPFP